MRSDLSGISGPRLGLGLDSGWSHLSPPQDDAMGIDFDKIADEAVDEVFGRRGGGAVWRARHPVRAARRDYLRGGWGSPGWQASQAQYAPEYAPEPQYEEYPEEEFVEEGDDFSEEEGSEDFGAYIAAYGDDGEDEYGRRRPRARRRARRQIRGRRRAAPSFSAPEELEEEEDYGEYDPQHWNQRRGGPVVAAEEAYGQYTPSKWHQRRGGPVVAAEEAYGQDVPAPKKSSFRESVETGLGFGAGFFGAVLALNVVASVFSGGRR